MYSADGSLQADTTSLGCEDEPEHKALRPWPVESRCLVSRKCAVASTMHEHIMFMPVSPAIANPDEVFY